MRRYVALFPYKIQINQPLTKLDDLILFNFASTMISKDEDAEIDLNLIWFNYEAQFYLQVYVNEQNWRF